MKVGFIGVGNMGGPMCRNIIRNTNHEVTVFDLNPAAMAACTTLGAVAGTGVAPVAGGCDVVFTSLPMPKHVEEVALGTNGIAASARPGAVLIDLSTNAPATAKRVHAGMAAKGIAMLEAPVSGGVPRATDGTIVIMVGGDAAVFEAQLPLLKSFSREVIHVGEVGMGSVAKLCNNMLSFCNAAAASEALMLGALAGIDLHKLYDVICNASGNSDSFRNLGRKAFARDFKPGFALDLAHKDLRLALEMQDEHGMPGMIAPQVMNLMRMARAKGWGVDDSSSVLRVYEAALGRELGMSRSDGIRPVAWLDCAGGGQVVIDGRFAFIGHMAAPHGTSVVDVTDPRHPRVVAEIDIPAGLHSHKVRVANGIMIANRERHGSAGVPEGDFVGLRVFDATDSSRPLEIARWACGGMGVHRFTFDGRFAYISPEIDGYIGNIVMILDLADPARPMEVGRWWLPGQHVAAGETPAWQGRAHRCHHPIRRGDRLYVSYWHGGAIILDISDLGRPRLVSSIDTSPPFAWPTHSVVPVEQTIAGHRWMVVADEHVAPLAPDMSAELPAFIWMMDVTDETRPVPVGSFQVPELVGRKSPLMTGSHQPVEFIPGTEVAAAWFASGLRIIDISNPHALRQVAYHVPDPPPGADRPSSNDLCIDDRGLIYLIDRNRGLSILERA